MAKYGEVTRTDWSVRAARPMDVCVSGGDPSAWRWRLDASPCSQRAFVVPHAYRLFAMFKNLCMCNKLIKLRMEVNGHDAHNTKRLVVEAARPGFIDTRFHIAAENCT